MMYPYPSYVAPLPSYDGGVEKHILHMKKTREVFKKEIFIWGLKPLPQESA